MAEACIRDGGGEMIKYEIKTDRFEFRFGTSKRSVPTLSAEEVFEEYQRQGETCPQIEGSFDSLEDARKAFTRTYANYGRTWAERGFCFWLLLGYLAWIEENEYDDDGEFYQGDVTYDVSAMRYEAEEEDA